MTKPRVIRALVPTTPFPPEELARSRVGLLLLLGLFVAARAQSFDAVKVGHRSSSRLLAEPVSCRARLTRACTATRTRRRVNRHEVRVCFRDRDMGIEPVHGTPLSPEPRVSDVLTG